MNNYLVEVGGEVRAGGHNETGAVWRVAIERPRVGTSTAQRVVELTNRALEFCQAFQAQHEYTRQFAEAVSEHGLLSPRAAEVTLKSGEKLALGGFRIIDEGKFNALSNEIFLEWRQLGWLHLVYCHLMSLSNWAGLVDRTAASESDAS